MTVLVNESFVKANTTIKLGDYAVAFTPPIDENYWLFMVRLSDNQAIVCFPKFSTLGIGFLKEDDWNTNLPYTCDTNEIFNHISHNKGDDSIPDSDCVAAILEIQNFIKQMLETNHV